MTSSARGSTSRGLRLGRVRGVPVILSPGWALISVVLVVLFTPTVQLRLGLPTAPAALVAAGIPLLLALSVLLHELAHGLTAQRLGIRVREYVLSLWGGHTAFDAEISRAGASAAVAVVGPLTNAVLAVLFWVASRSVDGAGAAALVLAAVAWTNGFVAVFNALPALPMDGGRLLEALVWRVRGDRDLGTVVAGRCGQVVAVGLVLVVLGLPLLRGGRPDLFSGVWSLLIGFMLWQGATAAVRTGTARRAARGVDLRPLVRPVAPLEVTAPVGAALLAQQRGAVVLVGRGAWVPDQVAGSVPPQALASTSVGSVAVRLPPEAVMTELIGSTALAQVARGARAGAAVLVVLGPDGRTVGALTVADVERQLSGAPRGRP